MEIEHIAAYIKTLIDATPNADIKDNLGHAMEELGEVAKELRNLRYSTDELQTKTIKEALIEECVDCVITSIALYMHAGGKYNDIYPLIMKKCKKWEKNIGLGQT